MPFNGSGTFTILNTFLPGTTILSSPMNDNFTDIAGGLSDCLTRDGQAPMTAQLKAISGSIGAPGITFGADPTTGLYLFTTGEMGITAGGVRVALATALGFSLEKSINESGFLSPASISTNQNDYAPTNIDTSSVLRLTASGAVNITGMAGKADGTAPTAGRKIKLINIGSNAITLLANSSSSLAANRFGFPANFVLFAGQSCEILYDGTSSLWRMIASFQFSSSSAQGGCRFQISSSTVVALVPYKGNAVSFPSGAVATLSSSGISSTFNNASIDGTAAQTLSNTTLYYAYLWDSTGAGAYVIDWSTTGHATDATTGIEIKSGDATRVLVGMAYLIGSNFLDSGANRLVGSWFNRKSVTGTSSFSTARTTASTTYVEINSEIRINFLSWGDDARSSYTGIVTNAGGDISTALALDTTSGTSGIFSGNRTSTSTNASLSGSISPSEGFHFITLMGVVVTGTATWQSNAAANNAGIGFLTQSMVI